MRDNFDLEWTQNNMTSRQQTKSLSVTSDPITARLSKEMDVPLDDNHIADTWTYCHVFLDWIQSKRKLVWGLGNNGQGQCIEVKQDHMVISRGIEDREVMAVMAAWWCPREET